MASGSSGRASSGSKGFDFGSDDLLCTYEDYGNQEMSNGSHCDPVIGTNSGRDFHRTRVARSSPMPAVYGQQEDSLHQEMISTVEKTMKKYADNLMRFLEGISSRLSQLELYCYNLDKSIGEMRSDLIRDNGEAESKLKSLDKHLQEVHRSVQILRDKQELAETQKELAKLQLAQKESASTSPTKQSEEKASLTSEPNTIDNISDQHNNQLALALPHQVVQHQQSVAPHTHTHNQSLPQNVTQPQSYYVPPPITTTQLPNPAPAQPQLSQGQYLPSDAQYRALQMQPQVNQTPQVNPSFPQQFSQHWSQQQVPPSAQQHQIRPQPTAVYPAYPLSQPTNPSPAETLPSSMSMQVSFAGMPQPVRAESIPYGYGGPTRPPQPQPQPQPQPPQPQLPPQHMKATFGSQVGDGYSVSGPMSGGYMMYDNESGRAHHPPPQQPSPHFQQGFMSLQNQQPPGGPNILVRNPSPPQFVRNHPYNDVIEKLVSMGFRGDHVASVIQRMEESGQAVDFNAVLDRLNVHSSSVGSSQRAWSG